MEDGLEILVSALFLGVGLVLYLRSRNRKAADVLYDLGVKWASSENRAKTPRTRRSIQSQIGISTSGTPTFTFLLPALLFGIGVFTSHGSISRLIFPPIFGFGVGYIIDRVRARTRLRNRMSEIEFFLPIIMERVVMAVEAGLDILPAIGAVIDLEIADQLYQNGRSSEDSCELDPVTALLMLVRKLSEAGMPFDEALSAVAAQVDSSGLRHAFLHLGVAQREGGEIVGPLRELSDSSQLYYQESVEEEIAKLPVKATMPLVCTFAGLIISFVTSPLIQVLTVASKAMPK